MADSARYMLTLEFATDTELADVDPLELMKAIVGVLLPIGATVDVGPMLLERTNGFGGFGSTHTGPMRVGGD